MHETGATQPQSPYMRCGPGDGAVIETRVFDEEEIHENCTVQILRNSVTGEVSIGWWENE